MAEPLDFDRDYTEEEEAAWVEEQRDSVARYLRGENVPYREIGEWPAFHVQPIIAIFAIESAENPGRVGYWSISGDCPTDAVAFSWTVDHPREAIRHFSRTWGEAAECMLRGEQHHDLVIGKPEDWPMLGPLLQGRSRALQEIADSEDIWEEFERERRGE